jgi:serine/threonine-protein kinase RsbW
VSDADASTATVSVELSIPIQADLVVLARLTAATVASRVGFGIEDIEDLRLAVEELCLSVVGATHDGRLHLRFDSDDDNISVECRFERPDGVPARASSNGSGSGDDLSLRILDALVDAHGHQDGEQPSAWLRKRRVGTAG